MYFLTSQAGYDGGCGYGETSRHDQIPPHSHRELGPQESSPQRGAQPAETAARIQWKFLIVASIHLLNGYFYETLLFYFSFSGKDNHKKLCDIIFASFHSCQSDGDYSDTRSLTMCKISLGYQ